MLEGRLPSFGTAPALEPWTMGRNAKCPWLALGTMDECATAMSKGKGRVPISTLHLRAAPGVCVVDNQEGFGAP